MNKKRRPNVKGLIYTDEIPQRGSSISGTLYAFIDQDRSNPYDLDEGNGIITSPIKNMFDVNDKQDTFLIETLNSIYIVRVRYS